MAIASTGTTSGYMPANIGGFQLNPNPNRRRRMIVSIGGWDKCGKTHIALTAPGPIAYANFDTGLEGVINKFRAAGKKVYTSDYRVVVPAGADAQTVANKAGEVWTRLNSDMRAAWASPLIRSTVIDTESETWELMRLAAFGKLTQVMPHHYGPVNGAYRNFLNEVYDSDKNLILLGRMKEEWDSKVGANGKEISFKTGRHERVGFKDVQYLVQVNCMARYDPMQAEGNRFTLEIINCRQNSGLAGTILPESMCNFKDLAMLVYPDSTEQEWADAA